MKKYLWIIVAALLIIVVCFSLSKLSHESRQPSESKIIKIGVMARTTGDVSFIGDNLVRSIELAVDELRHEDETIQIIVEDVGGLSDQAQVISAMKKLAEVDHVAVIIDGMLSNGTLAAAPLTDEYHVVMITPLTGGENIDTAAEYLFRNGPSDIIAGTKPADDLYNRFGISQVALLTDQAEYTIDIRKHFTRVYAGGIVVDELINPEGTDYRTELLKVKQSNAGALVINTSTGLSAAYIIDQAQELGITIPIFANFLAVSPQLYEIAGNATEGVYIYDPEISGSIQDVTDLMNRYVDRYGQEPTILFHTTGGYDAVRMSLEAIRKVGYDGQRIHDYLLKHIKDWQGYNGIVSFDDQGNTGTGFVLKQIKNQELVLVE